MKTDRQSIFDLSYEDTSSLVVEWGYPEYHGEQIWNGMYIQKYKSFDEFKNLPKTLRKTLDERFYIQNMIPGETISSKSGSTRKQLFYLQDKMAIESVIMQYDKRWTVCISSQVGCSMGCVFCATGSMGVSRNLSSGEILGQVIFFENELQKNNYHITNIVVMGMGEPFNNYQATMNAIRNLNHPRGINIGERRFTVSTVGIVPGIMRFADEESQVNLAISLHASNDTLRNSLLPINKKYPISDLMDACRYYVRKTRRRFTFEWALIDGVNDTQEMARVSHLVKGILCHVNIISLNTTPYYARNGSTSDKARKFCNTLNESGIPCTVRLRRGIDIHAGCGQLVVSNRIDV